MLNEFDVAEKELRDLCEGMLSAEARAYGTTATNTKRQEESATASAKDAKGSQTLKDERRMASI